MRHWFFDGEGRLRSGWKAGGFVLVLTALAALYTLALKLLGYGARFGPWTGALLGGLASYLCVRLEGRHLGDLGLRPGRSWLLQCLAGAGGGVLLILATALVARAFGGFHWERTPGIGAPQALGSVWLLLAVAFNEELVARGYPFQRLVEGAGPWVAQLVFAGLFALMHWGNPGMHGATKAWATLNIGLAALLLGLGYLRTRSLALPIGLHLGWNWAQGALLGFGVSGTTIVKGIWTPVFQGRPEWLTGGTFGLEASLPCAFVCGAAILGLWRWRGLSGGASTASES